MATGVTNFPTALDTAASILDAVNDASSLLAASISSSDTSLTVADASLFPTAGIARIDDEFLTWTGKSTNTLTGLVRGFDGSTAAAHAATADAKMTVAAGYHNVLADALIAIETKLGYGSDVAAANEALLATGTGQSGWAQITNAYIASGAAIAIAKLAITGTPDGTKFLRDDGAWAAVSSGSGTVASSSVDQVPVYTAATVVTGSTDWTFTRSTAAKLMTVTSGSSSALIRVTPVTSGNSGFSNTTSAHPGSGGGLFLPFVAGAQSDGPGIWWTNGAYSGLAGIWLSGGFNLQGWNSSNSALKIRKGTGTSSDGAATFTIDPDSGYLQASPFGTSAGETSEVRFLELAANGSNYFAVKAADNIATTRRMVWPNDDPSAGEFLKVTSFAGAVITTEWGAAGGSGLNPTGASTTNGDITLVGQAVSGGDVLLDLTPAANTAVAAEQPDFIVRAHTTTTNATTTNFRFNQFLAPTLASDSSRTTTRAATLYVSAAPTAGTNMTITTPLALWVDDGNVQLDGFLGVGTNAPATTQFYVQSQSSGNVGIRVDGGTNANIAVFNRNTTAMWVLDDAGRVAHSPVASTSSTVRFNLITAADTTLGTTAEVHYARFGGSSSGATVTRQWNSGTLATQREHLFVAPTIAFTGASTCTTAATLAINAAPIAGTNATITNAYALWVQAGLTRLDGSLSMGDAANMVLGTTTGTKIGTGTTEKLGFWGITPVVQQILATGGGATVDNVITFLQTIGLCKQS